MKLKIEITMDNAAFEDGNDGADEAARILVDLAKHLNRDGMAGGYTGIIRQLSDSNGNTVGEAKVTR